MEWVNIFDMRPADATNGVDDAVPYLVFVGIPNYGGVIQIATWMNNSFCGLTRDRSDVTHWMPLPPAPEVEQ